MKYVSVLLMSLLLAVSPLRLSACRAGNVYRVYLTTPRAVSVYGVLYPNLLSGSPAIGGPRLTMTVPAGKHEIADLPVRHNAYNVLVITSRGNVSTVVSLALPTCK